MKGSFKARRRRRHDDDAIYSVNEKSASQSNLSASNSHEAFLRKLGEQASRRPTASSHFDRLCPLERTMSSPLVNGGRVPALLSPGEMSRTGLAYDPVMLKHACMCGDDRLHPENPTRLRAVYTRIKDTGLADKCCVSLVVEEDRPVQRRWGA